jgi:hypothetical protein
MTCEIKLYFLEGEHVVPRELGKVRVRGTMFAKRVETIVKCGIVKAFKIRMAT